MIPITGVTWGGVGRSNCSQIFFNEKESFWLLSTRGVNEKIIAVRAGDKGGMYTKESFKTIFPFFLK